MRVRMSRQPDGLIDGVCLDKFRPGTVHDVSTSLASVFLTEGWAELVMDASAASGPAEEKTRTARFTGTPVVNRRFGQPG